MIGKCKVVKSLRFFFCLIFLKLFELVWNTLTDETSTFAFNLAVGGICQQPIMRHQILNIKDFCKGKATFTGTPKLTSQQCLLTTNLE